MLCKDHDAILGAFKFCNVEQRQLGILFFTVNELKLDSEIKNNESYSFFRKTSRKS